MNYVALWISHPLKKRKKFNWHSVSPSLKEDTACRSQGSLTLNETEQKEEKFHILQAPRMYLSITKNFFQET